MSKFRRFLKRIDLDMCGFWFLILFAFTFGGFLGALSGESYGERKVNELKQCEYLLKLEQQKHE